MLARSGNRLFAWSQRSFKAFTPGMERFLSTSSSYHGENCWSCGSDIEKIDLFCKAAKCGVIQGIKSTDVDIFGAFDLPVAFEVDSTKLDQQYKELQKKLHPDKFANKSMDEKSLSTNASSVVNLAYQTLKDPVSRAEYLVKLLFKREPFSEKTTNQDKNLMLEMFEWRERVSDCEDAESVKELHEEITSQFAEIQNVFSDALRRRNVDEAVAQCVRMRYFGRMLEELDQKVH